MAVTVECLAGAEAIGATMPLTQGHSACHGTGEMAAHRCGPRRSTSVTRWSSRARSRVLCGREDRSHHAVPTHGIDRGRTCADQRPLRAWRPAGRGNALQPWRDLVAIVVHLRFDLSKGFWAFRAESRSRERPLSRSRQQRRRLRYDRNRTWLSGGVVEALFDVRAMGQATRPVVVRSKREGARASAVANFATNRVARCAFRRHQSSVCRRPSSKPTIGS